jgi:hypothetical protein
MSERSLEKKTAQPPKKQSSIKNASPRTPIELAVTSHNRRTPSGPDQL